jgi:hypothetical protein
MSTDITQSDITVTIPALSDSANIVTAFTDYHTDMAAAVAALGRATNIFTGNIAVNGGDVTTTATTFNLINTNATTVNLAGAGTAITLGASGSGTTTLRNTTVAMAGAATVGTTLAVTGNTTLTGDLAVNGGDLTTSASTFNLLASPTTVNIAAAGTAVTIGATTGETTVRNDLVLGTAKRLIFEGATANDYETILTVVDPTLSDKTITFPDDSGNVVLDTATQTLTNKTLTTPDINAGTVDSLTSLSVRDTSAAYDVRIAATSSTTLTAGRTLTLDLVNAARTLKLGSNFTTLTNAVTLTGASGGSSVTLPASGTLATLTGTEVFTNKTLTSATLTSPVISTIVNTGTLTLPTSTDVLVGRATTDTLTNKTITLAGSAGTTAPLTFTTGTKISPIAAGTVEYDGNLFFATPKVNNTTAGRGLLQTEYSLVTIADNTQTVTGTANTDFYALNKSIYLAASQAYFVEMSVRVYHTLTYSGLGSGSATFLLKGPSGVSYKVDAQSQVDMVNLTDTNAPEFKHISSTTASRSISSPGGASDQGYSIFKWSGVVYVAGTAGNFGPAINLTSSSSYSSSFTVQAGSYCKVTPLGTYAAEINHGGWA